MYSPLAIPAPTATRTFIIGTLIVQLVGGVLLPVLLYRAAGLTETVVRDAVELVSKYAETCLLSRSLWASVELRRPRTQLKKEYCCRSGPRDLRGSRHFHAVDL